MDWSDKWTGWNGVQDGLKTGRIKKMSNARFGQMADSGWAGHVGE